MQLQNQEDERMEKVKRLLCLIFSFFITHLQWSHAFLTKQEQNYAGELAAKYKVTCAQLGSDATKMILYAALLSIFIQINRVLSSQELIRSKIDADFKEAKSKTSEG